jgi:hypothetical protein
MSNSNGVVGLSVEEYSLAVLNQYLSSIFTHIGYEKLACTSNKHFITGLLSFIQSHSPTQTISSTQKGVVKGVDLPHTLLTTDDCSDSSVTEILNRINPPEEPKAPKPAKETEPRKKYYAYNFPDGYHPEDEFPYNTDVFPKVTFDILREACGSKEEYGNHSDEDVNKACDLFTRMFSTFTHLLPFCTIRRVAPFAINQQRDQKVGDINDYLYHVNASDLHDTYLKWQNQSNPPIEFLHYPKLAQFGGTMRTIFIKFMEHTYKRKNYHPFVFYRSGDDTRTGHGTGVGVIHFHKDVLLKLVKAKNIINGLDELHNRSVFTERGSSKAVRQTKLDKLYSTRYTGRRSSGGN